MRFSVPRGGQSRGGGKPGNTSPAVGSKGDYVEGVSFAHGPEEAAVWRAPAVSASARGLIRACALRKVSQTISPGRGMNPAILARFLTTDRCPQADVATAPFSRA